MCHQAPPTHLGLGAADGALVGRHLPLPVPLPLRLQLGLRVGDGRLGLLAPGAAVAWPPGLAPLLVLRAALQEGGEEARETAAGWGAGSGTDLRLLLGVGRGRGRAGLGGGPVVPAALLRLLGWPLAALLLLLLDLIC